jgi:DNA polymerase I-like protein with 3'-5' exonuclease and polymerase domains
MFVEFDLSGAEWVIVAYLADDKNMIDVVESGRSPHVATGALISGAPEHLVIAEHDFLGSMTDPDGLLMFRTNEMPELMHGGYFVPRSMTIRQAGKRSNHGLNYDMRYRRFALENEMPETDAKPICEKYHNDAYPGVRQVFHVDVINELKTNDRTLVNLFGDKVRLMEQGGPDLWDKAYSYKPQSTVAKIVTRAMVKAYNDNGPLMALAGLRANVHDSVLLNWPDDRSDELVPFAQQMVEYMSYEFTVKGRRFTLGVDVKVGPNWGTMEKLRLPKAPKSEHVLEEVSEHGRLGRDDVTDSVSPDARSRLAAGQDILQQR